MLATWSAATSWYSVVGFNIVAFCAFIIVVINISVIGPLGMEGRNFSHDNSPMVGVNCCSQSVRFNFGRRNYLITELHVFQIAQYKYCIYATSSFNSQMRSVIPAAIAGVVRRDR